MPRSLQEVINHAEDMAERFEHMDRTEAQNATSLMALRSAVIRRSDVEQEILDAVNAARVDGRSWAAIGAMLGTSGEAARQRYGATSPVTG